MRAIGSTALVFFFLTVMSDRVFIAMLRPAARLSANFSRAFLAYEILALRDRPRTTIVLGDSVLWGYDLPVSQTAVAHLSERGYRIGNLAYEGGSPVNTYAMLRTLLAAGVRPQCVVFNVNQKVFNSADSAYATIHPSVLALARSRISGTDLALLSPRAADTIDDRLDDAVSKIWQLYAMRSDVRETLFGDVDAAHALASLVRAATGATARSHATHEPTAAAFEGTYDLAPLTERNVSVHFLERTADLLAAAGVPAIAILTPTNHALLHDSIDTPAYDRNLAYVSRILARRSVRVVDLDRAFAARDFIDNDHLDARGNRRLANLLATVLPPP